MTIYERYCMARDSKGLKDANVALGTKIGKSTFSDWKSGRSVPKSDKLLKIAEFLDISFEWLSTGEEKEESPIYYTNEETAAVAQKIFEEDKVLFDVYRSTDKDRLVEYAKRLKALRDMEEGEI